MTFLTQENYIQIQEWLRRNSKRDSDFNEASIPLKGNELFTFVQNGENVKILFKDLLKQLITDDTDIINVSARYNMYNIDITEAVNAVSPINRKRGLIITFLADKWVRYQFIGENLNQWGTISKWQQI